MSTLQNTPRPEDRTRTRTGARVLALSALAALGLALLLLTLANHRATTPTTGGIAHRAALTAQTPAPAGYFRDPATHKLLRLQPKRHRAGQLPANHSRGRVIP